jgi:YVTN family beta-propeller protein
MRRVVGLVIVVVLAASSAAAASTEPVVGPGDGVLVNGRHLYPAGQLVPVGNFPTGGALTPDGRFYWSVSTGRGRNDVRIVDLAARRVVQVLPIPGASGGIVMDPNKPVAYVSGVADSSHKDQQRPTLAGREGDVIQVFRYDPSSGTAGFERTMPVPPPAGSPIPQGIVDVPGLEGPPQNFPPTNTKRTSWPDRLAVSGDGTKLLVPLNLADHAAIVDTATAAVSYVGVGHYPYGAAILSDNRTGLVSNESDGTVSVIDLASGTRTADIRVGPALSHPEAIAVDPPRHRAYVAVANLDRLVVIDTASLSVVGHVSMRRDQGLGAAPVALTVARDRLLVAEEGADDLAVYDLPSSGLPTLAGRIPTADFPADVAVTPGPKPTIVYLSAKGLGVGPNPNGPDPTSRYDNDDEINHFSYLPSIVTGDVGVVPYPSPQQLASYTETADRQLIPANAQPPPAGTPLRPDGPIKHVFFVVRENRTYDQILGDDPRGDGDRNLELFGPKITPNIHRLTSRFPLLDHVYANSEASIDGHFWTSAAMVPDYVHKNWMANYGGRGRPYDFGVYSVTWPGNGFLFDQAERQGISYFNYGEAIAGVVPVPDKDRTPEMTERVLAKFAHSDLGAGTPTGVGATPAGECYPNDASIATDAATGQPTYDATPPPGAPLTSESRFECFRQRFSEQLLTGTVPAFNYLVLPNDHTVGTRTGERTPQAMVADNDYGLGQLVDVISHSPIWKSSAIFVVEDDAQDGADHVDAHRIPAAVISPYTTPGAVVHTRYDFLSVLRSMELILGMEPIGLADAYATPMYDAFSPAAGNLAPYSAVVPEQDRSAVNSAASPDAALSGSLDFSAVDQIPERILDRILWHAVYGADATPPPPGPNADPEEED